MFEIIELLLVEKDALKIIKRNEIKKLKNIETIVLAIMAQIQEIPFEEMEKRFRENTAE